MPTTVTPAEARRRHIAAEEFAPCAEAFLDQRNPDSAGKLNYTFIGPGVTQSDKQVINLGEAHGFNVGGVTLPAGNINNLHLHFTAEVFVSAAGEWDFIWGNKGENSARVGRFDAFTIPTWIFRGFVARGGGEDPFMFSILGGDDTGGIIWHPSVLAAAEKEGMRLTSKNMVLDLQNGESLPAGESYMRPMPEEEMNLLPSFTPEEMEKFIVRWDNLQWRADALPGGGEMAAVLGRGMTAARHHRAQVESAHGFAVEWLRLHPGEKTGKWLAERPQVAVVFEGAADVVLNSDNGEVCEKLNTRSLFSFPRGAVRGFAGGGEGAVILLATGGDERLIPQWDEHTEQAAREAGMVFDADNRLSPRAVLQSAGL